jgi:LPXTG-site transpeptidase (sortase) family protein
MSLLRTAERLLLVFGVVCLGWAAATWWDAYRFQHDQRRVFAEQTTAIHAAALPPRDTFDRSAPIGRLDIPRLDVSVVVMLGDDDATLSKAVGHLPDTPLPWSGGNTALAGHRDTFFRPLERVKPGDDIYLDTPRGRFHYRVRRTVVVDPEDLWVLDPSANPTLTLITCYPFRYIGPAPKRFIVQAVRV